ncbi:MAG TPA: cupin domain-containing protein [Nitrososphaera sp.]|nr:cupin domain-containing protein [Nitrososphaera sp.]
MTTAEGERTFELQDLVKQLEKEGRYFFDFLKVRDLEAGIIVLHPGDEDTQEPHSADELYYVIEGSGFIELGKDRRKHPVKKGSIIFVPAKMHHRFLGNKDDLVVLYMFAE